jgi:16S rRNA G966 N2-methylase RsmD
MKPFFSFFGSKFRVAPHYPTPTHPTIIEPFSGSAGYSLRYPGRNVKLYDLDPTICGVWDYLIHVSPPEIRSLPLVFSNVDQLNICQEAKWLIGFWINKGCVQPSKSPSKWMRDYEAQQPGVYWGERIRERIASQVESIRHWEITQATYKDIPDQASTWFIDPPYEIAGKAYKFHDLNYSELGEWCKSRTGQVIVCENQGATWLPFVPFRTVKALEGMQKRREL